MTPRKLDYPYIHSLREEGQSWREITEQIGGITRSSLRGLYAQWKRKGAEADASVAEARQELGDEISLPLEPSEGVTSALARAGLNPDEWFVKQMWASGDKSTAHFVRTPSAPRMEEAHDAIATAIQDMKKHAPTYLPPPAAINLGGDTDEGFLFELSVFDPHFGMLAWKHEVGESYDLDIAAEDYADAVGHLLGYARLYNTQRILYIVGNDMGHVNSIMPGGKNAVTRAGTPQDVDGRMAKIFTTIRRAAVMGIDQARLIAPVDVLVVEGNHDPDEMYKLGEVLNAWYRNDDQVNIIYSPMKRKWYNYGRNTFMFTHGEEIRRKRDPLPLIMATECPADIWIASEGGCREIHTGHNHIRLQGGYYPTAEVDESRAIVTRSLPGLVSTDKWHSDQGYKHRRGATALVYRHSGGIAGLHEFNL